MSAPSRDFERGVLLGSGSVDLLSAVLRRSVGEWGRIAPYVEQLPCRGEIELVAAIDYTLGRDLQLTPTIQVCIADAVARSGKGVLVSIAELLGARGGVSHAEEKEVRRQE